jgi:CheY-like chemotaxis protein
MTRDLLPVSCPSLLPTVFVVDDDAAVLRSLERLLRSEGLKVATFTSAREFLERHDPDSPGCLLLDVAMPGMNGLELQRVLIADGQELPIILGLQTGLRINREALTLRWDSVEITGMWRNSRWRC